jgi:FkbM family methyltransferase
MLSSASVHVFRAGPTFVEMMAAGDACVKLARAGSFEPESLECWAEMCSPGGMVLDIGAYTGLFSIVAAKMGCSPIAFEPMPKHIARCRENFELNGVMVDLRNVAVTDKTGPTTIKFNPNVAGFTSGASLIRPSGGSGKGAESRPIGVAGVTVDGLGLEQCTAIKIDVERGEPMVLAGAQEALQRLRPPLLVEVLGGGEKAAVRAAVPFYRVEREMDGRNWLMLPC